MWLGGECDPNATGSNLQANGGNSAPTIVVPANEGVPIVTINLDGSATIVATFGNNAALSLRSTPGTITWTRSNDGNWRCQSAGYEPRYISQACPQ